MLYVFCKDIYITRSPLLSLKTFYFPIILFSSLVFLILCYINEVLAIMKAAKSLSMANGEYAFITLDLNTDVFYKDGQWTGNEGKGSKFPDDLNGIIDLSVYRPELSEEFKNRYKEMEDMLVPSIKKKLYHKVGTVRLPVLSVLPVC